MDDKVNINSKVTVYGKPELGAGEVVRIRESSGGWQADVAFDTASGRQLETLPVNRLEPLVDLWQRLERGESDKPISFFLKQLAWQFPLANSGGELSCARTDLLPHQILLTHDIVAAERRRFLVADEVGLGKTIETGMTIRELISRGEADRVLVVCPAGLTVNWQNELWECFGIHFDILGIDFTDSNPKVWETHSKVIASIDKLKQPKRKEKLIQIPRWDLTVFDEAHHLSRTKYGEKVNATQNYRLAESLRGHTRDLLFLTATPHQGDAFQFWSLVNLLDDSLFESPEAMQNHRGLLSRVMIRRTKREVTDADGVPLFMRRQVHSQKFIMATKERFFYDRLTEYLKEGYGAAGVGEKKTTSKQRAIGFVMVSFQKIMTSSPRAIRQALKRRLMVLLTRQQIKLENRGVARPGQSNAERIQVLERELRQLAIEINSTPSSGTQWTEAGAFVAQLKQKLAKRFPEEETHWALDGEEDASDVIYSDLELPDEAGKVRDLIRLVPDGTDRKFDTLARAIEQLRANNPEEKFIIFTQYRETLEYLREELAMRYEANKVVTIKGGPLADKIESVEKFWDLNGARFLLSTSAGGEGINLQCAKVLFNYDLPWNPMAVEQRIGRIHRYGQQDTVQIYNLIAEDTVEEKIYLLLEDKLLEIAQTIGKVDPVTGEVTEDFRTEVLGYLGSSPNYQDLYKKAILDKDYKRTAAEISQSLQTAQKASEALRSLTQSLDNFNISKYRKLCGNFNLDDLRAFVFNVVPLMGGAILPSEELFTIQTPDCLKTYKGVRPVYPAATFDRKLAMRRKNADLLGLGHPLVDAIIAETKKSAFSGDLFVADSPERDGIVARHIVTVTFEDGKKQSFFYAITIAANGAWNYIENTRDNIQLKNIHTVKGCQPGIAVFKSEYVAGFRNSCSQAISAIEADLRSKHTDILSFRWGLVGVLV